MSFCVCVCQTSARWSCVCWLTFPLTLSCSTSLPTHRRTSLPCWPLGGESRSLTHAHTDALTHARAHPHTPSCSLAHTRTHSHWFSPDLLAKVRADAPWGFSLSLSANLTLSLSRLPTPSLQTLIILLPWLPCQLPRPASFPWAGHPWAGCPGDYIVALLKYFCADAFLLLSCCRCSSAFTHRSVSSLMPRVRRASYLFCCHPSQSGVWQRAAG